MSTPETIEAARQASKLRPRRDEIQELSKVFAWMKPNDLIWNYWVNNYLLGNAPPAFDILFWKNGSDFASGPASLRLSRPFPCQIHFAIPAPSPSIANTPIDIRRGNPAAYVVAGLTGHITPWKSVYQAARILGPETTFVLSNAGHLPILLNPPGNPKATFVSGAAEFVVDATRNVSPSAAARTGSWWIHWNDWMSTRSGDKVEAAARSWQRRVLHADRTGARFVYLQQMTALHPNREDRPRTLLVPNRKDSD